MSDFVVNDGASDVKMCGFVAKKRTVDINEISKALGIAGGETGEKD
jgi:hypothetical protein